MPPKLVYAVANAAVAPWQAMTVVQREQHLPGVCLVFWLKRGLTNCAEFPTPARSDHSKRRRQCRGANMELSSAKFVICRRGLTSLALCLISKPTPG
jgi:hypothetical protein